MKALIQKLVEGWGPSGYEHHIRKLIQDEVADLCDEVRVDGLGNLICRIGSGGPKIMIAAHMDEIGVMATFVEPNSGYLRFTNIGGVFNTTIIGSRVRFEDGTIGVVGVPDLFGSSRTTAPDLDEMYIDVSDDDGKPLVAAGSPATFWRPLESRGNRLMAKSMDDRIGCVVAIETMKRLKALKKKSLPNELYFVFTVQEEVGLRGAAPAAYGVAPDIGISLDVTSTGDMLKNPKMMVRLGGGATIKVQDVRHIVPPAIKEWMVARAEADKIPYQLELLTLGSTDAAGIQTARAGVPSGCISIACRYVHTTSETVDLGDVEACVRLLQGLLQNPVQLSAG
jgi:tetrahedral aminopeptidase